MYLFIYLFNLLVEPIGRDRQLPNTAFGPSPSVEATRPLEARSSAAELLCGSCCLSEDRPITYTVLLLLLLLVSRPVVTYAFDVFNVY